MLHFGTFPYYIIIAVLRSHGLIAIYFGLLGAYLCGRKKMVLVLAEMLLLDLLEGLSRVLLECSTAVDALQLLLRCQLLRLVMSSLQRLRDFMNHLRALIIATKVLLVE